MEYRKTTVKNQVINYVRCTLYSTHTDLTRTVHQMNHSLFLKRFKYLFSKYIIEFGVRTAKLVQNKDEWGTSYEFHVNDIPIFCKGANYIPQSVFPAAVKDSAIENMIDQMLAANFNMVRVWGGGYYPDNIFYKTCDKKGLLVWQDLMFACAMYPGDSTFLKSVEEELNYQIPRISAHPSVILLNGNNEVDMAWKNWGFQLQ